MLSCAVYVSISLHQFRSSSTRERERERERGVEGVGADTQISVCHTATRSVE